MIVRVLDEALASKCDELLTKLIADERQYDKEVEEGIVVKDYFKNVITNKNNIILCYIEDDIVKGYAYFRASYNYNEKGYIIDGLYVLDEYRNQGIATKLIKHGMDIIKQNGATFVDINALAANEIALKLYKSLGFKEFKIGLRTYI